MVVGVRWCAPKADKDIQVSLGNRVLDVTEPLNSHLLWSRQPVNERFEMNCLH